MLSIFPLKFPIPFIYKGSSEESSSDKGSSEEESSSIEESSEEENSSEEESRPIDPLLVPFCAFCY